MISKVSIFGAGGLGREIKGMINHIKEFEFEGFYDDNVNKLEVVGDLSSMVQNNNPVIIAIGDPAFKKQIFNKLINHDVDFPVLVFPDVYIADSSTVTIGSGSVICAGAKLTVGISLGKHVLINLNSIIGHNVQIGDFTTILPGASISGNVTIGEASLIGSKATILPGVNIGKGVKVGAGAVVVNSLPDNCTAVGVPARIIK